MKSYRTSQDNFRKAGLFIGVVVSHISEAIASGAMLTREPANADGGEPILGMIDTGAALSMIRIEVAQQIGLEQRGTRPVLTFRDEEGDAPADAPEYPAHLRFDEGFELDVVLLGGNFARQQGLNFLIGRDVLQFANVCFHGTVGTLDISFHEELQHPGHVR